MTNAPSGAAILLALMLLSTQAEASECEVTRQNVMDGYAEIGAAYVGSYFGVTPEPGDPKHDALIKEGMYVADYSDVHVFGSSRYTAYVFVKGECVVAQFTATSKRQLVSP